MIKELSPLEAFRLFCKELKIENSEFANAIETSLKENAELKRANFELEERIGFLLTYKGEDEDKVKALEIIKEKEVNVYMLLWYFEYCTYEEYVKNADGDYDMPILSDKLLTLEEYDFLKEMLL